MAAITLAIASRNTTVCNINTSFFIVDKRDRPHQFNDYIQMWLKYCIVGLFILTDQNEIRWKQLYSFLMLAYVFQVPESSILLCQYFFNLCTVGKFDNRVENMFCAQWRCSHGNFWSKRNATYTLQQWIPVNLNKIEIFLEGYSGTGHYGFDYHILMMSDLILSRQRRTLCILQYSCLIFVCLIPDYNINMCISGGL